jgi:hypothetical protein
MMTMLLLTTAWVWAKPFREDIMNFVPVLFVD